MLCESFADGAAQVCSPIHTYLHLVREPLASGLQTIRRARVYEALKSLLNELFTKKIGRKNTHEKLDKEAFFLHVISHKRKMRLHTSADIFKVLIFLRL